MRTVTRGAALACLVVGIAVSSAAATDDSPQDLPAEFVLDISATVGKPMAVVFTTTSQFWQLPNKWVRRGYGLGFCVCTKPDDGGYTGRAFVDVEPMGNRKLAQALDDVVKGLAEVAKKDQCRIVGTPVTGEKPEKFALGKAKLTGQRFGYDFQQLNGGGDRSDHAYCVALEVGKALVVVSTEKYARQTDYFDTVVQGLSFVPLPMKPGQPRTVKVTDNVSGVGRYVAAVLSDRWMPETGGMQEADVARWVRRDAKGQVLSRVTLFSQVVGKDFDLAKHAGDRATEWGKLYEEVSAPAPRKLGGHEAFVVTYVDKSDAGGAVFQVRRVIAQLVDQASIWGLEVSASDEKDRAADEAAFEQALASVKMWRSKIQ